MINLNRRLIFSAVAASLACPLPAYSQLEEIIVTAQRRQENLQDVPISVVAISGNELANSGIDATLSIPEMVPSVQLLRSGPVAMFFVRGVGNTSAGTGEEAANAVYIDGVYVSDMKGTALKFNNIERIEVLKGPQGTLFGRNASGGLINVITKEPGDQLEVDVNVGFSNYDTTTMQAYVAGPISNNLKADIALTSTDQQEGWGERLNDGDDAFLGWDWGARSKWVLEPSDTTKFTLSGEYGKMSSDFSSNFLLAQGAVSALGNDSADDEFDTRANEDTFTDQRNSALTLTAEIDLGWATLTSISGYRDNETETSLDVDTGPVPLVRININSSTTTFQEEIRLASNDTEPLSWQTGLFFLNAESELKPQRLTGLAFGALDNGNSVFSKLETESVAAFGEVTYALTPTTHITAGLRYTEDERDLNGSVVPLGTGGVVVTRRDSVSDDEMTYRFAIRQDIGDNHNVYASYNRGFKSGTFSMSAILNDPVDSQTIDAYEIGLKSELLDSRLRVNVAAFMYDISDYQIRAVAPGAGANAVLLNAAEVEVTGLELEFEAAPMEGLNIFGYATFLDSEYADFPGALFTYPNPSSCTPGANPPGSSTGAPTGGSSSCIGDAAGNDTPLAPEFAASLGGTYTMATSGGGEVRMTALYSYNDGFSFESDNRLVQPSFGLLNASVAYQPNAHWSVELWGRNLNDELHYVQKIGSSTGDFEVPAAPRTYGVNFRYTY